jgi:hypothetical protein
MKGKETINNLQKRRMKGKETINNLQKRRVKGKETINNLQKRRMKVILLFCRLLIVSLPFILLLILLPFTVSYYPFGIFKIFSAKLSTPSQARRNLEPNFTKEPPPPPVSLLGLITKIYVSISCKKQQLYSDVYLNNCTFICEDVSRKDLCFICSNSPS